MENRVEILFPILNNEIKQRINQSVEIMLADNVKAREQDASGHYHYVERIADEVEINSQQWLCEKALLARKPDIKENKSIHDLKEKIVRFGSLSVSSFKKLYRSKY